MTLYEYQCDRRYMAEILLIRRKTLSNQSINQYQCEILIMTSNNHFKETMALHCDVRLDVERGCLHAHDTHVHLSKWLNNC